jgi:glutathione S-transferase
VTVPVLIEKSGRVTRGSDRILERADVLGRLKLIPESRGERDEVRRWLRLADETVGPEARRFFYSFALEDPPLFAHLCAAGIPRAESALMRVLDSPVRSLIRSRFAVHRTAREEASERLADAFARADARRSGGPYLVGDRFTAADLAFAALAAPTVFPEAYGAPLPPISALPSPMRAAVWGWRTTGTGEAVLDLYARHRPRREG